MRDPFEQVSVKSRKAGMLTIAAAVLLFAYALVFPTQVAVEAFLAGRISWARIAEVCDATLQRFERSADRTVDDIIAADARARQVATEVLAA